MLIGVNNSSLTNISNSLIGLPDYTNLITMITTKGASYTAEQNGWLMGAVVQKVAGCGAWVKVNNQTLGRAYSPDINEMEFTIMIPIVKGDIITTRPDYGEYSLSLYGIK